MTAEVELDAPRGFFGMDHAPASPSRFNMTEMHAVPPSPARSSELDMNMRYAGTPDLDNVPGLLSASSRSEMDADSRQPTPARNQAYSHVAARWASPTSSVAAKARPKYADATIPQKSPQHDYPGIPSVIARGEVGKDRTERRLQEMRNLLAAREEAELTFKPHIHTSYETAHSPMPVLERVMHAEIRRRAEAQRLQAERQQREVAEVKPVPEISEYAAGIQFDRPVHQRLYCDHEERKERIRNVAKTYEEHSIKGQLPFQPHLSFVLPADLPAESAGLQVPLLSRQAMEAVFAKRFPRAYEKRKAEGTVFDSLHSDSYERHAHLDALVSAAVTEAKAQANRGASLASPPYSKDRAERVASLDSKLERAVVRILSSATATDSALDGDDQESAFVQHKAQSELLKLLPKPVQHKLELQASSSNKAAKKTSLLHMIKTHVKLNRVATIANKAIRSAIQKSLLDGDVEVEEKRDSPVSPLKVGPHRSAEHFKKILVAQQERKRKLAQRKKQIDALKMAQATFKPVITPLPRYLLLKHNASQQIDPAQTAEGSTRAASTSPSYMMATESSRRKSTCMSPSPQPTHDGDLDNRSDSGRVVKTTERWGASLRGDSPSTSSRRSRSPHSSGRRSPRSGRRSPNSLDMRISPYESANSTATGALEAQSGVLHPQHFQHLLKGFRRHSVDATRGTNTDEAGSASPRESSAGLDHLVRRLDKHAGEEVLSPTLRHFATLFSSSADAPQRRQEITVPSKTHATRKLGQAPGKSAENNSSTKRVPRHTPNGYEQALSRAEKMLAARKMSNEKAAFIAPRSIRLEDPMGYATHAPSSVERRVVRGAGTPASKPEATINRGRRRSASQSHDEQRAAANRLHRGLSAEPTFRVPQVTAELSVSVAAAALPSSATAQSSEMNSQTGFSALSPDLNRLISSLARAEAGFPTPEQQENVGTTVRELIFGSPSKLQLVHPSSTPFMQSVNDALSIVKPAIHMPAPVESQVPPTVVAEASLRSPVSTSIRYVSGQSTTATSRESARNHVPSPLRAFSPAFPSLPLSPSGSTTTTGTPPSTKEGVVLVASPLRAFIAQRVSLEKPSAALPTKAEDHPRQQPTSSIIRSESQPKLILNLEFSLSPGVSVNVPVFEGDLPDTVARKFMHDYGLTDNQQVENLLVSLIASRMAEL